MRVSTKLVERIVRMIDCGRGGEGGVEGGEGRRMWGGWGIMEREDGGG